MTTSPDSSEYNTISDGVGREDRNQLDELTAEIGQRTGGKLLGEMTNQELLAAFAAGPVHFDRLRGPVRGQNGRPAEITLSELGLQPHQKSGELRT